MERCNRNNIRILPIIVILIIKSHKKTIKNKFTKSQMSNPITPHLSMAPDLPTLRKKLLHQILLYNQSQSQSRHSHSLSSHRSQLQYENSLIQSQKQSLKNQKKEKFLNVLERRRYLREEYQREIKEKMDRERKERERDRAYAILEREHAEVRDRVRQGEMLRMFGRRSYQGIIVDNTQQNSRIKTQPISYQNPQYTLTPTPKNLPQPQLQSISYKDSLDSINIKSPPLPNKSISTNLLPAQQNNTNTHANPHPNPNTNQYYGRQYNGSTGVNQNGNANSNNNNSNNGGYIANKNFVSSYNRDYGNAYRY